MALSSYILHQTDRRHHFVFYDDNLHRTFCGLFPCKRSLVLQISLQLCDCVLLSILQRPDAYPPGNGSMFVLIQEKLQRSMSGLLLLIDAMPGKAFLPPLFSKVLLQRSYSATETLSKAIHNSCLLHVMCY